MKINNKILAPIILIFLALAIFNIYFIINKIDSITGKGASAIATVSVSVTPNVTNVTANVTNITLDTAGVFGGGREGPKTGKAIIDFTVHPPSFSILAETDSVIARQIFIKNIGDITLLFTIGLTSEIISLDKNSFSLAPNQEATIMMQLSTKKPGNAIGKISFVTDYLTKEIPFIANIKSKGATFRISLDIDEKSKTVKQGEELPFRVTLSELDSGFIDISYIIKDSRNRIITKVSEIKQVNDRIAISKSLMIPEKLREGSYVLAVEVSYKGLINAASESFRVKRSGLVIEEPAQITKTYSGLILFIVLALIMLHIFLYIRSKRKSKP